MARATPKTHDGKKIGMTMKSDGTVRKFVIESEVDVMEGDQKRIVLQLLRRADGQLQYRIGYYVISIKGESKGRWVWARNTPQIFPEHLSELLTKASERGWYPTPAHT